jgi:hypothetical protein
MTRWRYPGGDPENGPAYDADLKDRHGNLVYDEDGCPTYRRVDGTPYRGPQWRREKREEQKMPFWAGNGIMDAHYLAIHRSGRPYHNPYPPGARHKEFAETWERYSEGGWK